MGWNRLEVRRLLLLPAFLVLPLVFASCGVGSLGGIIASAVLAVTMIVGLVFMLLSSSACSCSSTSLGPCLSPDSGTDPDGIDVPQDMSVCLSIDPCLSPPFDALSEPDVVGPCLDILPDAIDPSDDEVDGEDDDSESECFVGPCLMVPPSPGEYEGAELIPEDGPKVPVAGDETIPSREAVIDGLVASGVIPAKLAQRMKRLRG